jgi:hypothetical protein
MSKAFCVAKKLLPKRNHGLLSVAEHVDDSKQSRIKGLNRF